MRKPTFTCWPVLVEVAWLLQQRREPPELVLEVCETGAVIVEHILEDDMPSIRLLLEAYRDLRLQLADASLLQIADRLRIERIYTFDHRDFLVARTPKGHSLQIVGTP